MLRWCLVCVISNSSSIQTLHNDYSQIEDAYLLFCVHLINTFAFFEGVAELKIFLKIGGRK